MTTRLRWITNDIAPELVAIKGVGPDVASTLLMTAGDNPERMTSEAAFAALCGSNPIPASSGKTNRHRLNRGGDRHANTVLWRIVVVRLSCDQRTRDYVERRTKDGKTRTEIIRCLKRYLAREIYNAMPNSPKFDSRSITYRPWTSAHFRTPAALLARSSSGCSFCSPTVASANA